MKPSGRGFEVINDKRSTGCRLGAVTVRWVCVERLLRCSVVTSLPVRGIWPRDREQSGAELVGRRICSRLYMGGARPHLRTRLERRDLLAQGEAQLICAGSVPPHLG